MRNMFFRLYNDEESLNIRLNVTDFLKNQTHVVDQPPTEYLQIQNKYMAPIEGDLVIPAVLSNMAGNSEQMSFAEVFFTGLNTSTTPPSIFEIMHFNSDGINLGLSQNPQQASNMNITLRNEFAKYGGILTVRMPYPTLTGGIIDEFYYGPFVKIVSSGKDNVVPENTIGVFPLPRKMIIIPPTQTMICAAMGNPRPTVTILKDLGGGNIKPIASETVILDSTTNMVVHTFRAENPQETEGRYLCR